LGRNFHFHVAVSPLFGISRFISNNTQVSSSRSLLGAPENKTFLERASHKKLKAKKMHVYRFHSNLPFSSKLCYAPLLMIFELISTLHHIPNATTGKSSFRVCLNDGKLFDFEEVFRVFKWFFLNNANGKKMLMQQLMLKYRAIYGLPSVLLLLLSAIQMA
jgi:hypothetical protein